MEFWRLTMLLLATAACSRSGPTLTSGGIVWGVIDGAWKTDGDALIGSGGLIETVAEYGDAVIEADVEQHTEARERTVGFERVRITPE